MDNMPEDCRVEWDSVTCNHVFSNRWFQRERYETLQSIAIVGLVFSPMVKSVAKNGMEAVIRGLVSMVQVIMAMRFWLDDSWLRAAASASGDDNAGEIHSLEKNSRFGLNWLCMAIDLLKALFCKHEFSHA
jgi:hypothetical protein